MQSNDVLGNYVNFFIVTDFGKKIEMTKSNKAGSGPGIIKSLFLKIWEIEASKKCLQHSPAPII